MSRTVINFWLDTTLLVSMLVLVWLSTIIRFVFPPAANAENWKLWGGTLDQWINAQFVTLGVLTFLVVVHVMLHWTWVCGVVTSRFLPKKEGKHTLDDGTRTLYGVGLLIVLLHVLALATAAAVLSIQGPPY